MIQCRQRVCTWQPRSTIRSVHSPLLPMSNWGLLCSYFCNSWLCLVSNSFLKRGHHFQDPVESCWIINHTRKGCHCLGRSNWLWLGECRVAYTVGAQKNVCRIQVIHPSAPCPFMTVKRHVGPPWCDKGRVIRYSGTSGIRIWVMPTGKPLGPTCLVVDGGIV